MQLNCGLALLIAGRAGNSFWGGTSELFEAEGASEVFAIVGGKWVACMKYS